MNITSIRERIALDAVRWAPKGFLSAAIGWGARTTLPRALRSPLYRAFARYTGLCLEEAELPLGEYPTLAHFFARRLRSGARVLDTRPGVLVAPCDGVVAARGVAHAGHLIQAKGKDYELERLVVDPELAARLTGGPYLTIYLSPRDYHRVHAPIRSELQGYSYVPGTYYPVNPLFSRSIDDLMARNERVVFKIRSEVGAACLVMVAALGVSNIEVAHDRIETRYLRADRRPLEVSFEAPVQMPAGEELGAFHLGSTTIMIFEPDSVELEPLEAGDVVRFGQPIGRITEPADRSGRVGPIA